MPHADFCSPVRSPYGHLSRRSDAEQISWGKFSHFPCTIAESTLRTLMDMEFAVSRPLVRHWRLLLLDQSRQSRYRSNRRSAKECLRWYCNGCSHGIAKIPDRDRTQRSVASYLAANGTLNRGFVRHADFLTRRGPPTQSRSEDPAGGSALSVAATSCAVRAQTSMTAFLPEMNSHFRLSSDGMYGWSSMPMATWNTAT